jgi:CHAT domain-containing protein/tetratricopeptide (TPR) repeat protein
MNGLQTAVVVVSLTGVVAARHLPVQAPDSDRARVETLLEAAATLLSKGDSPGAAGRYREARDLARAGGHLALEASALNGLGRAYDTWAELDAAVEAYDAALAVARAAGERRAEASAIGNLGRMHHARGESQRALEAFREALSILQALGDRQRQAVALQAIGAVYHALADPRTAVGYYEESLRLDRATESPAQAITMNTLALARSALGEHASATRLLDEALEFARKAGDSRTIAYTLHNLGDVHRAMKRLAEALQYQQQSLPLRRASHDRLGEARVLIEIGALSRELGQRDAAVTAFRTALPITEALQDRHGEALARTGLTRLARDEGDLDAAQSEIESALQVTESIRDATTMHELRTAYMAESYAQYELYIDVLMRQHAARPHDGFDRRALDASERARARSLVELLAEAAVDVREGADPALVARERRLQRRLNAKADRHRRLLGDDAAAAVVAAAAAEVAQVAGELEEIHGRIRTTSPRYAALARPQPLASADIQRLLDAETTLLEYAIGDERGVVWVVTPTSITSFELPGRDVIDPLARRVYQHLTARQAMANETPARYRQRVRDADARLASDAALLSATVLGPVASRLASRRLLVVADGALRYVPFGALPRPESGTTAPDGAATPVTGAAEPLLARHEIVSLPSASALAAMRENLASRRPAPKAIAVLADPVFDAQDERVRHRDASQAPSSAPAAPLATLRRSAEEMGIARDGGTLARLPFTRREAENVLSVVGPREGFRAVDFRASRATATSTALRDYRIVHIATHGLLNDDNPQLSGLVLSLVDENGAPQDGFLRLHDIYNLELHAELVVLSACQTALGKDVRGEGLIGLTRGLMYSGASRVMATLWQVDDVATAELMKRFYTELFSTAHPSPAAALRAAQASMSRQPRWAAPYYWAGFVLQGEPASF